MVHEGGMCEEHSCRYIWKRIEQSSGQEAGDPEKLAEAVITVTESENPHSFRNCLYGGFFNKTSLLPL